MTCSNRQAALDLAFQKEGSSTFLHYQSACLKSYELIPPMKHCPMQYLMSCAYDFIAQMVSLRLASHHVELRELVHSAGALAANHGVMQV